MDFLEVVGAVQGGRRIGNLCAENDEEEDVGYVEDPGPAERVGGGVEPAIAIHGAAISKRGRVARQKNEDFRRVAKGEVTEAQLGDRVGWDMIDEDPPQGDAAKEI